MSTMSHGMESPLSNSSEAHGLEKTPPAVHAAAENILNETSPSKRRGWRFWFAIGMLCLIGFAASFDNTIIFTALPTIVGEIGGESQYIWIANSYVLASVALQPLTGQLCNIFGRKTPFLVTVSFFAIGAGLSGGASSPGMLICGRTIQGLGCGGILVLIDIIICDITSQRERGKYLGIVLATCGVGSTLGPLIGGAVVKSSWRWVFYMTLPFSALALVGSAFFLQLEYQKPRDWKHAVSRIDIFGNSLFVASIVSICLGLIFGGGSYAWSSSRVIVPLVLGFVGWFAFHVYEATPFCKEPTMPPRLFTNRTAIIGFILTFIFGMLVHWCTYILPLYFQAVRHTSPLRSAVDTLPFNALLMPFGILGGALISATGRYIPLHAAGFAFCALGTGLLSAMNSSTKTVEWVFWQLFVSLGLGLEFTTILPAIQVSLPERDVASATATFSFMRSFGMVWAITVPSVIFNSRIDHALSEIHMPELDDILGNGKAYAAATGGSLGALSPTLKSQADKIYTYALSGVWYAALAFCLFGFVAVFGEKQYKLKEEVNDDFGIAEKRGNVKLEERTA